MTDHAPQHAQVQRIHPSLWLETTPGTEYPRLSADVSVDVAVVGGGIAGLTTALLLKQMGKTVALLEGSRIVEGVSAYTTAKVTSLHTLIYADLLHERGEATARNYGAANQAALARIARFIDDLAIDCDFARVPAYTYTLSADETTRIQREVEAAQSVGLPAHFVTETPLPLPVAAAVRFDNQARFHPRKYLLALAQQIPGDGSYLFEQTHAHTIDEDDACRVVTPHGTVTAHDVVIATHFPFKDDALYFARMTPHFSYLMAMTLDEPVPEGVFINTDASRTLRRHVTDGQEYLLVGGEGHITGQGGDTKARYDRIEAWAREHFAVRAVQQRWATEDYHTPDHIPYIGLATPLTKHVYVATGFKGWGMTSGTLAGLLLSDLITGRDNPWAELFSPNRVKLSNLSTLAQQNLGVAAEYAKGLVSSGADTSPETPGTGCLVNGPDGREAQFRDADGVLHRLSPVCPHMGCLVNWNDAEETWDCPCHGSRFAGTGEVIHGPAHEALPKKG